MEDDIRNFYISVFVATCLAMLLTLIPIWQLVIIPGIIAGIINKSLKRGIISGGLGVTISWGLYILVGDISRNVYSLLDQLGGLIFGEGFGWAFIILILLLAAIIGAIGGGIGNGLMALINIYREKHPSRGSRSE